MSTKKMTFVSTARDLRCKSGRFSRWSHSTFGELLSVTSFVCLKCGKCVGC